MSNITSTSRLKSVFLALLTILTTSLTAAQAGSRSGAWSILNGSGERVTEIVSGILYWEIATIPQLAIFIAMFAGLYFIVLKMINLVFDYITTAIDVGSSNSFSVSGGDGEVGKAEKGISVAIAFITAQYLGPVLIAGGFALAGLVALAMVAISFASVLGLFSDGRDSIGLSSDNSGNDRSFASASSSEDEAAAATSAGESDAESAKAEADDAEKQQSQGNDGKADSEANEAAGKLEQALEELEVGAQDIEKVLNMDKQELQNSLEELHEVWNDVQSEEELIQRLGRFPGELRNLIGTFDDVNIDGAESPSVQWDEVVRDSEDLLNVIEALKSKLTEEKQYEGAVQEELSEEIKQLVHAHKLIRQLKKDLNLAERTDEELDDLASKLQDKGLHQKVEVEEGQEKKLMNQIKQLIAEENEIESVLSKFDQIMKKIEELDDKEIMQMRNEMGGFDDALEAIESVKPVIQRRDYNPQQLQQIQEIEGRTKKIRDAEGTVLELKMRNEELIENLRNHLEEASSQVESEGSPGPYGGNSGPTRGNA